MKLSRALWLHEIKHDGFRVFPRKDGQRVKLAHRFSLLYSLGCAAQYYWRAAADIAAPDKWVRHGHLTPVPAAQVPSAHSNFQNFHVALFVSSTGNPRAAPLVGRKEHHSLGGYRCKRPIAYS